MTRPAAGPRIGPLVLATMASQALLVVLAPTITAIAADLTASVSSVGQARSVTAIVAVTASLTLSTRIDSIGVRRLLVVGSVLAVAACAAAAAAPNLPAFLAAHVLVGAAFACQLTAGFAGVAAFDRSRRPWAFGHVAGANALAWIVVNPAAGVLTQVSSWRLALAVPALLAVATLLAARTAVSTSESTPALPLRALLSDRYARRWIGAELLAFGCWTSLLTFAGAFFIERTAAGEATAGWLLAAGAAAYFVASTRSAWLVARVQRRHLVASSALVMAALLPIMLTIEGPSAIGAGILFSLIGLIAGVRTPASSGLGLDQLPEHAQAMMAIRTAVTQLGYFFGALLGGAVIAGAGYGTLGAVLAIGMAVSALLVLRIRESRSAEPKDSLGTA